MDATEVDSNLNKVPGSFCEKLDDKREFDERLFVKLTDNILTLNKSTLDELERHKIGAKIWEIGLSIERMIKEHYADPETHNINNLSNDELRQLSTIVFYMSNWFTYNKEMEADYLKFGKW